MKNITLSAEEHLIESAWEVAKSRKSTVNALFREWLADLVKQRDREAKLRELDERLAYARPGGTFSREEMNER
jgi:hypothetical protein